MFLSSFVTSSATAIHLQWPQILLLLDVSNDSYHRDEANMPVRCFDKKHLKTGKVYHEMGMNIELNEEKWNLFDR